MKTMIFILMLILVACGQALSSDSLSVSVTGVSGFSDLASREYGVAVFFDFPDSLGSIRIDRAWLEIPITFVGADSEIVLVDTFCRLVQADWLPNSGPFSASSMDTILAPVASGSFTFDPEGQNEYVWKINLTDIAVGWLDGSLPSKILLFTGRVSGSVPIDFENLSLLQSSLHVEIFYSNLISVEPVE